MSAASGCGCIECQSAAVPPEVAEHVELESQSEARRHAAEINRYGGCPSGLCAVAMPWPLNCWGGTEHGWVVAYLAIPDGS